MGIKNSINLIKEKLKKDNNKDINEMYERGYTQRTDSTTYSIWENKDKGETLTIIKEKEITKEIAKDNEIIICEYDNKNELKKVQKQDDNHIISVEYNKKSNIIQIMSLKNQDRINIEMNKEGKIISIKGDIQNRQKVEIPIIDNKIKYEETYIKEMEIQYIKQNNNWQVYISAKGLKGEKIRGLYNSYNNEYEVQKDTSSNRYRKDTYIINQEDRELIRTKLYKDDNEISSREVSYDNKGRKITSISTAYKNGNVTTTIYTEGKMKYESYYRYITGKTINIKAYETKNKGEYEYKTELINETNAIIHEIRYKGEYIEPMQTETLYKDIDNKCIKTAITYYTRDPITKEKVPMPYQQDGEYSKILTDNYIIKTYYNKEKKEIEERIYDKKDNIVANAIGYINENGEIKLDKVFQYKKIKEIKDGHLLKNMYEKEEEKENKYTFTRDDTISNWEEKNKWLLNIVQIRNKYKEGEIYLQR